MNNRIEAAERFHKHVDTVIRQAMINGAKHCCRAGCHYCCYEPVYCEESEVDLILSKLTPEQLDEVAEKTKTWLAGVQHLLPQKMPSTFEWRNTSTACPFLKNGMCMVYQHRPMGCREFFAINNPEHCRMPMRKHQKFWQIGSGVHVDAVMEMLRENRTIEMDNLGVFLAKKLLGVTVSSGSRSVVNAEEAGL